MRHKVSKLMILSLEAGALLMALCVGLTFLAYWNISHGGLSLRFVKGHVESSLEKRLAEGSKVSIASLVLSRYSDNDGSTGPLRVSATELLVTSGDGQKLIELPELGFELRLADILRGKATPRYVEIAEADIRVKRDSSGKFDLGLTPGDGDAEGNVLGELIAQRAESSGVDELFEGAILRSTNVVFTDDFTSTVWTTSGATAEIKRMEDGYSASLSAPFAMRDHETDLEVHVQLSDIDRTIILEVRTQDAPVSELLTLVAGPEVGNIVETTLSGTVVAEIDYSGNLHGGSIDISADAGRFRFAQETVPFESLSLKTLYTEPERRFDIETLQYDLAGNKGKLTGVLELGALQPGQPLLPENFSFVADGVDLLVDFPGVTAAPLPINRISLDGEYDGALSELHFSRLEVDLFGKIATGNLDLLLSSVSGESTGVRATASIVDALTTDEVLRAWPLTLADGARRWVVANVISGDVSDINFRIDIPRGAIKPATSIGYDAMALSFSFDNASSYFVPGVTPLSNVAGKAELTGNSLLLTTTTGRVGSVRLVDGEISMPAFYPKGSRGIFKAKVAGAVPDILAIVDEEPLGFVSDGGFSPTSFRGDGEFSIEITRPLLSYVPIDDYTFNGKGNFRNLSVEDIFATFDVERSAGTVGLSWGGLVVDADAYIADTPMQLEYNRQFTNEEETTIRLSGVLDARLGDDLGIPLRNFLRGDVPYFVSIDETVRGYENLQIGANLTQAELFLEALNWTKEPGVRAQADFSLSPSTGSDGMWSVDRLEIEGDGLKIDGQLLLGSDGHLVDASFDRVYIRDLLDLAVSLRQPAEGLIANITGDYARIDFLIDRLFNGGDGDNSALLGELDLQASIKTLELKNYVRLSDFSANISHLNGRIPEMYMQSTLAATGGSFSVRIGRDSEYNIGRSLIVSAADFGQLAQGIFDISSINGGAATYTATILEDGLVAGTLSASDFVISNAPLIARLFSAASLNGFADLLAGEGIRFDTLSTDLQIDDGALSIVDARVTGPSVGISINGDVDFDNDNFDISGAMAPAYSLNSALGQIPGLGPLLISRRGEGIVAFSYQLQGPVIEPVITVNALSMLTPGIIRRIFEPVRDQKQSTADLLDEAVKAAAETDQLRFVTTPEQLRELEESLDLFIPQLDNIDLPLTEDIPNR